MERKRYLGRFKHESIKSHSTRTIRTDDIGFAGYAALVHIHEVNYPFMVGEKGAEICIADKGYIALNFLPDNENWYLTAFYDNNNNIVEWYFDVTRKNAVDESGVPYCDDLYLDAALLPDGSILTFDEDELKSAFDSGQVSRQDYDMAHGVIEKLIAEKILDVAYMESFCSKLRSLFAENKVLTYYEDYTNRAGEDNRATSSRSASLEFHYTKKILDGYIGRDSRVLEVGCATGYYGFHFSSKCKEYVGIDLFPHHIEIFQRKIAESGAANLSCRVGDATNLDGIEDNSFDVVLCLGPMYHLPVDKRELVFAECNRVCKPDGVVAFAYVNKIGTYFGACLHDEGRKKYPNQRANDTVLKEGINDDDAPFFFSTPEEMEAAAMGHGLIKIRSAGLDFFNLTAIADKMDDEKFKAYLELFDVATSLESCAGMSEHALLVCRKKSSLREL